MSKYNPGMERTRGVPFLPNPKNQVGTATPVMRPGKTRREKLNGAWLQHVANKETRRDENKKGGNRV